MEENKKVASERPERRVKVRSAKHFELRPSDKEKGGGISLTVPDESLSIRQIMERFSRGQGSGVPVRDGQFDQGADFDSPDIEKLDHLDLIDRDEFARANEETRVRLEKEIEEDKKRKKEEQDRLAQEDQEIREKFRSEKKSKGSDTAKGDEKPKG